jgi:hypothetical protein
MERQGHFTAPQLGEALERSQPPCDATGCVCRQLMCEDQLAEVFDGRRGNANPRHLQLVEPDRVATAQPLLGMRTLG